MKPNSFCVSGPSVRSLFIKLEWFLRGAFTHEPIYASKRAHLDGPITPVVMDSSTELGSFLMMTSDWGLSQSSEIFFIIVAGYVLYWLNQFQTHLISTSRIFGLDGKKSSLQSKGDKKEVHKDECSYDPRICVLINLWHRNQQNICDLRNFVFIFFYDSVKHVLRLV